MTVKGIINVDCPFGDNKSVFKDVTCFKILQRTQIVANSRLNFMRSVYGY